MDESDGDRVQDAAEERRRERTRRVEAALSAVREDLGEQSYPVASEELAATYADGTVDLPNETESLGSAFGRLEEEFEDERIAYEALVGELGGDEDLLGHPEGDRPATWSEDRVETGRASREDPMDDAAVDSGVERSRQRAREAQAGAPEESAAERAEQAEPEPDGDVETASDEE